MANDIPRDHPLYPVFKTWADSHLPHDMMRPLWWECFLLGAKADRLYQVKSETLITNLEPKDPLENH